MWKGVMVSFVLLFWYLIGEIEETHEKTKAPGSEVKTWDRNAVYPHVMEHVEYFSIWKEQICLLLHFFFFAM